VESPCSPNTASCGEHLGFEFANTELPHNVLESIDTTFRIESPPPSLHHPEVNAVATINKLSKLFGALAEENVPRAEAIASEIANDEEQKGHHGAARLLKGSLRPNSTNNRTYANGSLHQAAFTRLLADALAPQRVLTPLSEICLRKATRAELTTIMEEWRNQSALQAAGVPRRSRLFFHGPPGCGKSLTARALGLALSLPTYVVRFDGVIGAYLGQTAIHLRELFRFAEITPCVLIFDEVDALGKRRGNPMDVGELDRIVIALMQELEHSLPAGIVVATSNLPAHLDPALWRRFDLVLEFPAPVKRELIAFTTGLLKKYDVPQKARVSKIAQKARSYAEAERLIQGQARSNVLAKCQKK
jgi:hypothetical protein